MKYVSLIVLVPYTKELRSLRKIKPSKLQRLVQVLFHNLTPQAKEDLATRLIQIELDEEYNTEDVEKEALTISNQFKIANAIDLLSNENTPQQYEKAIKLLKDVLGRA